MKKSKKFVIVSSPDGKALNITGGPDNFSLDITIDYDDVDQDEVDANVDILVNLLNEYWPV